jgi:DMSO/TMAO reductase YedYZ molybdopterin-dependent catalytic subunit
MLAAHARPADIRGLAMNRRRFVLRAAGAVGCSLLLPHARLNASELPAGARASELLDALPGKRPLIKRTFRPPNYETPVALFAEPLTPNDAFYVRWHMGVPDVDAEAWRLRIDGPAARTPRELAMQDLRRLPRHEVVAVNQCSGNRRGLFEPHVPGVQWGYGAMGNARWAGARLKDVLESAGIAAGAVEVVADGADAPTLGGPDFAKSLPMWKALDPDTLVAWEMNGEPLPRWNGAPARLVVPGWTATYWVKALTRLSLLDQAFDGFWMKSAYRVPRGLFGPSRFDSQDQEQTSPITDIRVNSLVVSPAVGAVLPVGRRKDIRGIAWDGGSGIRRVEVSLDRGASWREAALEADLGRYAWRTWRFHVTPKRPGDIVVLARAIAADGSTQAEALIPNPAGYHHNVVQQVGYRAA